MAANSKIANRAVAQISRLRSPPSSSVFRRGMQGSVYDKNQGDLAQPNTVHDDVTERQADKYWAPHPKTGVFGPADESSQGVVHSSTMNGYGVMEEKAWFRHTSLEDMEKPM